MNKITLFTLLLFSLIAINPLYAQEDNIWAFGANAGIDFSSGTPVAIQTAINVGYGACGSVCNASGQLLFYTDGDTIYNKYGQIMPNGSGLIDIPSPPLTYGPSPTTLITQGVLIVPMPDSSNKYYVFSTTSDEYSSYEGATDTLLFGRLYYSVVDMGLNGGAGDVEAGRKGILLDTNVIAGITGIAGSDCNVWLLCRSLPHLQFRAYNITSAGIDANPVISGSAFPDTFTSNNKPVNYLAVAPNHQKIASAIQIFNYDSSVIAGYLQLFDFDSATGMVANNNVSINFHSNPFFGIVKSACFSSDNSKLYTSGRYSSNINQYDLTNTDSASIVNSETYIGGDDLGSDLQIGPDDKIYFMSDATDMGDIDAPNLAGGACGYNPTVIPAFNGTQFTQTGYDGLPNIIPIVRRDTVIITSDTAFASGGIISAPQNYSNFLWNDSTTNSQKTITTSGTYWVYYYNAYCQQNIDTFHVSIYNESVPAIANPVSMNVYPNPAKSKITVDINSVGPVVGDIQMINVLGQVVLQQTCNQNKQTINVANLTDGIYIIAYKNKGASSPTLLEHILISR